MIRFQLLITALIVFGILFLASTTSRAMTCKNYSNAIVKKAVEGILNSAIADHPELESESRVTLVKSIGNKMMGFPNPEVKIHAYLMLLWYGDQADFVNVTKASSFLTTPAERAHYSFAIGLYQISAKTLRIATKGRNKIRHIKKTGHVKIIRDDMWQGLITKCKLPTQ